ncbi:MAG: TetR family transcriptional regulator [Streptosporangiales bacterium]|nr:TetR family transcriptional regulator [Streptosporangiales bacterium]
MVVTVEQDKRRRILDAAEALLISYGYRKVTIDEVAAQAQVGKGTVYLYRPSKRELFGAVIARDSARMAVEHSAALAADPAEVRLHRHLRRTFLMTMRRPLAKALATADQAVLGEVLAGETGARFAAGKVETMVRYMALLHRHGLLADDPEADPAVLHRVSAVVLGAYLLEGAMPAAGGMPGAELDLQARADALATTVRRAFEPADEPSPATLRAAAAELAELGRQWAAELTDSIPEPSPGTRARTAAAAGRTE